MAHRDRESPGPAGKALLCLAAACALLLAAAAAPAAVTGEPLYAFGAVADWVNVAAPDYGAELEANGLYDGAAALLLDRQVNVTAAGDEHYEHFAVRVVNSTGVDAYSQATMAVDPSFQALTIHWLRVVRDGNVIDQRELARITATPEENDLRNRIYNGRYVIDVLFADVRPGDVVEYAYTLSSREQLFPGHFSTRLYTGWSQPVHEQRIRIRSPRQRPLTFRLSDSEVAPVAQAQGEFYELVLEWRDLAPIPGDPDRPGWFDPWPYLEASDLASWEDVTRLVSPLFPAQAGDGPRVARLVNDFRSQGGTLEEQALRALRFVQDEIAYASISIGRGTHEPADPDVVLQRRYGDCKDKSLLLATLLRGLGAEAQTALVHSSSGRALDEALPTPYAFDHAIVWTRIGAREFWLDATAATQYSPLSPDSPADYERALLVHAASPELRVIPDPAPDTRSFDLLMEFDLTHGIEEPAALTMTTRYGGRLADGMRMALRRGSPEQRQVDYTNYIASYYPGATASAPITISDDTSANVVEVREFYTLPRTFTEDSDGWRAFFLHADELYEYGEPLDASVRAAPLALQYPIHARQKLVVHLPEAWTIEPEVLTVEDPAFRYRGEVSYSGRTLTIDYDYTALANHVPSAELERYQENRRRFYDHIGYRLTYGPAGTASEGIAPVPLAAMLGALFLGAFVAVRWGWRYDPEPRPARPDAPVGLGGWLVLPAIGVILSPLLLGWAVWYWGQLLPASTWAGLTVAVEEGWAGTVHVTAAVFQAANVLLVVASLLLVLLFFRKRTSAPHLFVGYSLAALAWGSAVQAWTVLSGLDTETTTAELVGSLVRDTLVTLAWTLYMLRSQRVRATFVNRLPGAVKGSNRIFALQGP